MRVRQKLPLLRVVTNLVPTLTRAIVSGATVYASAFSSLRFRFPLRGLKEDNRSRRRGGGICIYCRVRRSAGLRRAAGEGSRTAGGRKEYAILGHIPFRESCGALRAAQRRHSALALYHTVKTAKSANPMRFAV
jgi:hypothetical protein